MRKFLLIASFAALATACGGSQTTEEPTSQPVETVEVVEAPAAVRFVHASSASPIRVFAGGAELTDASLAAGTYGSRMAAPAGEHALAFRPSGGGEAFATVDASFDSEGAYTVVFAGDPTSVIRAEMPTAFVVADDLTAPAADQARVRFIHAATGVGEVSLSDGAGRGYAAGLGYGSASAWYDVAAGSNTVEIAAGGEVVATLTAPFTAGMITTVVIGADGEGVAATFINETGN